MTSVLLVDDHEVVRRGIRSLLECERNIEVAGEAANGIEALQLAKSLEPDVAVVDLMMPGLNGLEVIRQIRSRYPATRVVVLSMHASEAYVLEALRGGAIGYVLKESTAADLVQAVRFAAAGRRFLSPPLSDRAVEAYARRSRGEQFAPHETLTPREREVLYLAAGGHSNPSIAAHLGISRRTVETHRSNLMRKLGLANQTALVRYCMEHGILRGGSDVD